MNTLIKLTLPLLLISAGPASADVVALTAPQVSAVAGTQFDAPFTVAAAPSVGALQLDVLYDAARLENLTVDPAVLLTAAQGGLEFNVAEPGRVRIALACSKPIDGDGPLFRVRGTLKAGSGAAPATLQISAAQAWQSKTLRELRVDPHDGAITPSIDAPDAAKPNAGGFDFWSIPPWAWGLTGLLIVVIVLLLLKKR